MKFSKLSCAILSVIALSACGGGGGSGSGETSNENHEPIASFSTRINYLEVIATDTSTDEDGNDDILKYSWFCSDGSESNEKNFKHVFVEEGTYTISHYVTDRDGKQSSVVSEDIVVERKNHDPVASFDFTTNNLEVVATNTSYDADGNGDIISYLWKSSDGGLSHSKDFSHVFRKAGTYTVSLTVTDSKGAVSNQYSKAVTVKQNSEDLPVASFSVEINGNTVTATYDGTDEITELSWSSSDGGLSKSKKLL
ncbi:PKD domain-containing protein [Succinimonas amylolytica]|uniref:PKD domain-containing protein n=1 Tax=Succinimonas amylolytica TaxID=83769 RepID=UPI000373312C|nr:PKD domain-containing protein [Succinimonas amylolytica]